MTRGGRPIHRERSSAKRAKKSPFFPLLCTEEKSFIFCATWRSAGDEKERKRRGITEKEESTTICNRQKIL